ncbi:MAG: pyridoxamine 5'-phosphate oxidase family protein [Peptostreptococcus sp.]|uniref:pyridoxamine 5'-phosphate oxidase family protein n=1 Tax=Peptostreptococcus sp. TaxID=1262 RepID=UPI002FC7A4A1
MFRNMRRKDREISINDAREILTKGSYGVLSTLSDNGYPYGIPVNYIFYNGHIYFHSAKEGHKLDNIRNNSKVSFCVVGSEEVLPDQFTTDYESAVVFGEAKEVSDIEKEEILLEIIKKYSPEFIEKGKKYIGALESKTTVVKIEIKHLSGKSRK